MRFVTPVVLLVAALIHALPLVGVLGVARLKGLYGLEVSEPNLEIVLRHRAVLFGALAAFCARAAFHRELHTVALVAAIVCVASFLLLTVQVGGANAALMRVFTVDAVLLPLLLVAAVLKAFER